LGRLQDCIDGHEALCFYLRVAVEKSLSEGFVYPRGSLIGKKGLESISMCYNCFHHSTKCPRSTEYKKLCLEVQQKVGDAHQQFSQGLAAKLVVLVSITCFHLTSKKKNMNGHLVCILGMFKQEKALGSALG
jgi:hypothetical protein